MALPALKSFIETRLRALDPAVDLEPGSPAQTKLVEPLLRRLGTDPFETDIAAFITDRYRQEFPHLYAADPSVIHDTFVKPLIVFLEPFKREVAHSLRGRSLRYPELLSDEEADDLAANVFEERDGGGFASGAGRLFFAQPAGQQVEITTRFFTAEGLGFYPTSPVYLSAEQMVFNKKDGLYYMDVPLRAEKQGAEYNIEQDALSGVEGVWGAVKVGNPRRFGHGASALDTASFVAAAREGLTERSLVNPRGAAARLRSVFKGALRASLSVGAGDAEMQRDLLVGSGPGDTWAWGEVAVHGQLAKLSCRFLEGALAQTPAVGETLFVFLPTAGFPGLSQEQRLVEFTVEEVLAACDAAGVPAGYLKHFLVRFSGPSPVPLPPNTTYQGGLRRPGMLRISSTAGKPSGAQVSPGAVHLHGHTDIYVRPALLESGRAVLSGLADEAPMVERAYLSTTASSNAVQDTGYDFGARGVRPGDVLVLEGGRDAGVHTVCWVVGDTLRLARPLTATEAGVRYRVLRYLTLNPFEPRVRRLPFGDAPADDLLTAIGSDVFELTRAESDLVAAGVRSGDTVRLKTGGDTGDFTVKKLLPGGKRVQVDRPARASASCVTYEVFAPLEKVERPLVRLKEVVLLDSGMQSTGIVVPPAEPVAVRPVGALTGASVRGRSSRKSGYVLPDLAGLVLGGNVPGAAGGLYQDGHAAAQGSYRAFDMPDGSQVEVDMRADTFGACSWFVAYAESAEAPGRLPIDPKAGDCLTLKSGPNAGSYLIDEVVRFEHQQHDGRATLFLKVRGGFKTDVLTHVFDFLERAVVDGADAAALPLYLEDGQVYVWPDVFAHALYGDGASLLSLGEKLELALTHYGFVNPGAPALQTALEALVECDYEWGTPARGVLRTYFQQPLLFEQRSGSTPTRFCHRGEGGEAFVFVPDAPLYEKGELVPARSTGDSDPTDYPRDLVVGTGADAGWTLFTDAGRPTVFAAGVTPDDVLSVHEERFQLGTSKARQLAVQTQAGSNLVKVPSTWPAVFSEEMKGDLFFLEEGDDAGAYRVVEVLGPRSLALDAPLSQSTPVPLAHGQALQWGKSGADQVVVAPGGFDFSPFVGAWLTLVGVPVEWQGSYEILTGSAGTLAKLSRSGDFPAVAAETGAHFVVTAAPLAAPAVKGSGTVLVGAVPVRQYAGSASDLALTTVDWDGTRSRVQTAQAPRDGEGQPYRFWRRGVRRVTPEEMARSSEGPLFYFDTQVVSLSPSPGANLPADSYLTLEEGSYVSHGWRHRVADASLSYSVREEGQLELPVRLLPEGSPDSPDHHLTLVGMPAQLSYEKSSLVQAVQDFIESRQERTSSANMLARHFLPAFVSYDALYRGGSAPAVIARDIAGYIDTLPVEAPLDVSRLQDFIAERGGNPKTPTRVVSVLHDWRRRAWAEFSENELGGSTARVPYAGSPRVAFFVPGPDVSAEEAPPRGERLLLTRQ